MKAAQPVPLAWHYTTGQKFRLIVALGLLCPSRFLVKPPERPVLWFSLNQQFEPTARKATKEGGCFRVLSMEETAERGCGLVRFGVRPRTLLTGEKLRTRAHIARAIWDGLIQQGRHQKADPALWFGTLVEVPIERTTIEVWNEAGAWERVQGGAND
jgi:hypothetical protein